MVLAVAIYSLTLVMAAFPFMLNLGQALFIETHGQLAPAFMIGLGEWYFIGITMLIASVLIAVDTVFDAAERPGPLVKAFAIWSAISGFVCLVLFTIFTVVKSHLTYGGEMSSLTILISTIIVAVTVIINALTYIKLRITTVGSGAPK